MRPDRRSVAAALAMGLGLTLAGCQGTEIEDLIGKVAWFANMRDQPAVEPYEVQPLQPPEGAVSLDAGIPLMARPDDYAAIANPTEPTRASIGRGQELYDIFCIVCHGARGRGGGSVEGPFPAGLIPSLASTRARGYSDGYIFGLISAGRGLMPNYRRIGQEDRWHIVNYVRQLQALTPEGDAGGGGADDAGAD